MSRPNGRGQKAPRVPSDAAECVVEQEGIVIIAAEDQFALAMEAAPSGHPVWASSCPSVRLLRNPILASAKRHRPRTLPEAKGDDGDDACTAAVLRDKLRLQEKAVGGARAQKWLRENLPDDSLLLSLPMGRAQDVDRLVEQQKGQVRQGQGQKGQEGSAGQKGQVAKEEQEPSTGTRGSGGTARISPQLIEPVAKERERQPSIHERSQKAREERASKR